MGMNLGPSGLSQVEARRQERDPERTGLDDWLDDKIPGEEDLKQ